MYYLIYEIRNNKNGKVYVGKHKTNDINDDYMGSGKILKRSIEKYGIENFTKTILFELETEQEMNDKEAEIVNEEFIKCGSNYNLMVGGHGGFDYINKNCNPRRESFTDENRRKAVQIRMKAREDDFEWELKRRKKISEGNRLYHENGGVSSFKGKKHSKETKKKISDKQKENTKGVKNSQYGSIWIYSLEKKLSKKIKKEELPDWEQNGWLKGRKMKF